MILRLHEDSGCNHLAEHQDHLWDLDLGQQICRPGMADEVKWFNSKFFFIN